MIFNIGAGEHSSQDGLVMSGVGLAFLGLGLLLLVLSILLYGKFLPWLFREIINGINRLFHRRRYSL